MTDKDGDVAKPAEYAESPVEFWQLMEAERSKEEAAYVSYASNPEYEQALKEVFVAYTNIETFRLGQLVQWKPRMKNQRFPYYGKPAVVLRQLEPAQPLDPSAEGGTESGDLVLGFLDGDGDLRTYMYSSTRFTAWEN